ncbi:MAG: 2Fe-2S iron-sulfur cluster binding domain-containing protein [Chlorobi bacterium]|nr:2Fe-2S iron-sulfur cluster binding domain-containing protein [Chlorobiota bacterium]
MSNKKNKNLNRRSFIKNIGVGFAGTIAAAPLLKSHAKKLPEEIKDSLDGKVEVTVYVNGRKFRRNIFPQTTLAQFIRDELNLTGTKVSCNHGECGSCTVLIGSDAVYSCQMLALDADQKFITTIEGLMKNDELGEVQKAFVDKDGLQCGFCTPGQIISAYALLKKNPAPSEEEIREAMSGNLCRCGAYPKIIESVDAAAKLLKK